MAHNITIHSVISGIVNGQALRGNIEATLDPDRGGLSACEFTELPIAFTPATFGTFG